ncbi:MAG TPA: hypothetical protein VF765_21280 [Polyangiaceae bacterium]
MTGSDAPTALEVREARRGAGAAALIAIVGEGTIAAIDARAIGFGALVAVRLVHVAVAVAALALLLLRPPSIRAAEVSFTLVAIPFQLVLAVSEVSLAQHGDMRDHGSWYKLVMLGIALLAPADPLVPSILAIALGVQKVVLRYVVGVPQVAPGEPWITLIFAAIAVGMLLSRASRREAIARAARVEAHAAALERVTRLLLTVRDRANTPLQTIALGTAIMTRRCASEQRVAAAMDRALRRLRRLSRALQRASQSFERATPL